MSPSQLGRWEIHRQQGPLSFVVKYGVLGWGVICGIVIGGLSPEITRLLGAGEISLVRSLVGALIVFPLFGMGMGLGFWRRMEREYIQQRPPSFKRR